MAVINRQEMLSDLLDYLPDQNVLSDTQLEGIINNVVDYHIPEDDEIYYAEALCKSLRIAGLMNKTKYAVDSASLKKEKVGNVMYEYSEDTQRSVWKDFLDSLSDICPYLPKGGYNLPQQFGIQVVRAEEEVVDPCIDSCSTTLIL
jgi:hypothetical protein